MKSQTRVRFVGSALLLALVVFVVFVAAAVARAAGTGTVEGAVYLNGDPLAGVEVWLGDGNYSCTDGNGGFSMQVPANEPSPAATGRSVVLGCPNADFVDPVTHVPLVTQFWDHVNTGYSLSSPDLISVDSGATATIRFDVVPAAAVQNVTVLLHGHAVAEGEAWVHAFDRDDPAFIAAYGRNPSPNQYAAIMEGSIGQLAIDWVGENGTIQVRFATLHDLLVLAREGPPFTGVGPVSGRLVEAHSFRDRNGDGVLEGPPLMINLR